MWHFDTFQSASPDDIIFTLQQSCEVERKGIIFILQDERMEEWGISETYQGSHSELAAELEQECRTNSWHKWL